MRPPEVIARAGRPAQKRRTRKAILEATIGLLADGRTPSVAEIAEAADVSRRTVYLYFPKLEHLLVDATLGALSQADIDRAIELPQPSEDAGARIEALARAISRESLKTMDLGRALVRLTIEPRAENDGRGAPRGYRRIEWIENALGPLRGRLGADRFERLVSALAIVIGWEALIVLQDIRNLPVEEQEDVTVWAARALLKAALDESAGSTE